MIFKMIISVAAFIILGPFIGGMMTGICNKASARIQGRNGADIFQPISDTVALLQKGRNENSGVQGYYVKVSLFFNILAGSLFFAGSDMLITISCLGLGIVFMVIAAYTSGTYYAGIGAERLIGEMVAAAPMMFMVAIGFYVYCGSFDVRDVAFNSPVAFLPLIGIFAGFITVPCSKLRKSSFEYRMPHSMYQRDMDSISDAFNKRDAAICEIASWYEKTVLFAFVFLFFANGKIWMIPVGIVACLIVCGIQGILENISPGLSRRRALKISWVTALIIGVVNLVLVYIIM
ncbi:MAG: NADH-quinone oxidoreductase subunit H [Bacillota bacterium]|nr:NADH-quinone oxidoreductase subunit H [Bacillota bacterium]